MIKKLNKEKTCLTYYCIKQCFHFVRSAGKQKKNERNTFVNMWSVG